MIAAILIGRKGSKGFPNKNIYKINNKMLFEHPLNECKKSKFIDKIFVATDSKIIKKKAKKYDAQFIQRPKKLNDSKALGEDVYHYVVKEITKTHKNIELFVLLFANSITLSTKMLDNAITQIRKNPQADSIVSVSKYNMWSPLRARKLNSKGFLDPFVKFEYFGNPKTLNCDRDAQGDVYYADMSFSIVKPKCFKNMKNNLLPQKWMGKKILPFFSEAGLDVDFEWQIPQVKFWLKKIKSKYS
ncbi:cytidylyltransferase [Pelagibacteraceae bacterium GOM-A5]|nr:cytidylyltransferase [Pelagibacteraceae bacterium GOM-A5]